MISHKNILRLALMIGVICFSITTWACRCDGYEENFFNNITSTSKQCLVVYEGIDPDTNYWTEIGRFTIIEKLSDFHSSVEDEIFVRGGPIATCNVHLDDFNMGDTLFLNLINYYDSIALDRFDLNGECGMNYLKIENGLNNGMSTAEIRALIIGLSAVEEENNGQCSINVYPNPTSDKLIIESSAQNIDQITIYNRTGSAILNKQYLTKQEVTVELGDKSSGIYFILVRSDDKFTLDRIIKN